MRSAAYKAKFWIGLREYARDRTVPKKARRNIDCARMMRRATGYVKPVRSPIGRSKSTQAGPVPVFLATSAAVTKSSCWVITRLRPLFLQAYNAKSAR